MVRSSVSESSGDSDEATIDLDLQKEGEAVRVASKIETADRELAFSRCLS